MEVTVSAHARECPPRGGAGERVRLMLEDGDDQVTVST